MTRLNRGTTNKGKFHFLASGESEEFNMKLMAFCTHTAFTDVFVCFGHLPIPKLNLNLFVRAEGADVFEYGLKECLDVWGGFR